MMSHESERDFGIIIVLCCTNVRRAIGEQRGYAAVISFRLMGHLKSMLCQSLLGGFRTYPFL
jgi:hypothetical protein